MEKIKETLKEFGLTDNESEVYLILLKSGNLTSSQITDKAKIHRMNVYSIIERLQEKGLVSFVLIGKRKYYEASNPKTILKLEEEKKKRIESIIPELTSQINTSKPTQEALIYKDKKGIKAVLEEVTNSETEVYIFASGWGFNKNFPEYYTIWHNRLVLNKVKGKMLISSKFKDIEILKPWECRYLPNDFVFPSTTLIYENKIFINIWGTPPLGILIKGKEIAESYRKYFEILWKMTKKKKHNPEKKSIKAKPGKPAIYVE